SRVGQCALEFHRPRSLARRATPKGWPRRRRPRSPPPLLRNSQRNRHALRLQLRTRTLHRAVRSHGCWRSYATAPPVCDEAAWHGSPVFAIVIANIIKRLLSTSRVYYQRILGSIDNAAPID